MAIGQGSAMTTFASPEVARRLGQIRIAIGEKSPFSMAKRLGMGPNSWRALEDGKNLPSSETLLMLAELGFSPSWILLGDGPMRRADAFEASDRGPLDEKALIAAVEIVEGWIDDNRLIMQPSKKAQVVATIYEMYMEDKAAGRPPIDASRARPILKLVSG